MNSESISSMARSHREALLREAALLRAVRMKRVRSNWLRRRVARAARAMGRACLSFGDALTDSR